MCWSMNSKGRDSANKLSDGMKASDGCETSSNSTFPSGNYSLTKLSAGHGFLRGPSENQFARYRRNPGLLRHTFWKLQEWVSHVTKFLPS